MSARVQPIFKGSNGHMVLSLMANQSEASFKSRICCIKAHVRFKKHELANLVSGWVTYVVQSPSQFLPAP